MAKRGKKKPASGTLKSLYEQIERRQASARKSARAFSEATGVTATHSDSDRGYLICIPIRQAAELAAFMRRLKIRVPKWRLAR